MAPDDKKDDKKKEDGSDERFEYIQNYLSKAIRLKSDKWAKMIQTDEYRVRHFFEMFLLDFIPIFPTSTATP